MKVTRKNIAAIINKERKEIGKFIEDHGGLVFHEIEFNKIVSESFNTELSYFIAYNNERKMIGVCPLHTIKKGFLRITYSNPAIFEVPFGGWVFDKKQISMHQLFRQTKLSFKESLVYWSNIEIQNNVYKTLKFKEKPFKFWQYSKNEYQTALIDLQQTEDEIIYNSISKNTRHNIKRAPKKGIEIEELNPDNFNFFLNLVDTLKRRLDLKIVVNEFYLKVFRYYYDRNKIKVFAAKHKGEYISAVLNIGNKNMTHAWIAGRINNIQKNLYQNELLWWESIKWAKEIGSRYYDLCVIEKDRLPQIAVFKLGFSKYIIPFYLINKKPITFRIFSKFQRCFISLKNKIFAKQFLLKRNLKT